MNKIAFYDPFALLAKAEANAAEAEEAQIQALLKKAKLTGKVEDEEKLFSVLDKSIKKSCASIRKSEADKVAAKTKSVLLD